MNDFIQNRIMNISKCLFFYFVSFSIFVWFLPLPCLYFLAVSFLNYPRDPYSDNNEEPLLTATGFLFQSPDKEKKNKSDINQNLHWLIDKLQTECLAKRYSENLCMIFFLSLGFGFITSFHFSGELNRQSKGLFIIMKQINLTAISISKAKLGKVSNQSSKWKKFAYLVFSWVRNRQMYGFLLWNSYNIQQIICK